MTNMKDEKKWLLWVAGVFTMLLIFSWLYGGGLMPLMFKFDWGLAVGAILLTAICAVSWYGAFKFLGDPNYDSLRIVVLVTAIAASAILLGYRAQNNLDKKDNIAPTAYVK